MARFLVSALGSAGDVHPFITISQALIARGHAVRMIASPHFEQRIERAGVGFVPLGAPGEYERLLQRPELWQPMSGARFIVDELLARLPEAYEATRAAVGKSDTVLVGSTLSWGMRLVQEVDGLPGATVHLSPTCIQSAIAPPILPGIGDLSWMPTWALRSLQRAGERFVLDRFIGGRLNAFRASVGLPPVQRIWSRWIHSPDLTIGAWPAWFAPRQGDWPPQAETSGFPVFAEGGLPLDPALERFLADGAPPIGITAGSAMAHGGRFFEKALAACDVLGRRAVLVTSYREQLPSPLPGWAHHASYAPFSALLPRLAAFVHHGGIGTSAQALAAGIPQAVAPFAHDQFDNATRLRRLGVSLTLGDGESVTRWSGALQRLSTESSVAAAVRLGAERMRADAHAADTIAARLERLSPPAPS